MSQEQQWLLNEKYDGMKTPEFYDDVKLLESGIPLAYIIGWVPFHGTKIYLDSHPLIPRPETEYWVDLTIEKIRTFKNPKVLDLCTGSGCIGITVLQAIPDSTVDFVEIDVVHHTTIIKNIQSNGISEHRSRIFGGNLFENITDQYDVILTNPPYINPHLSDRIGDDVLKFEPHLALFGGNDGMELIRTILTHIPRFLKPNGLLYIEHEPEQAEKIQELLPGIVSEKDQFDVVRFSVYQNT